MPLPLLANTISKIEIQESAMPIRIFPPILANQILVGGEVVEQPSWSLKRLTIRKIENQE
ncbi:hypothetical protein WP8W19C03_33150 [Aeromonas veronii]|uniref:Uncharacterized protein n=1 Tax=Aeromonas veronii TaxID=654 RepID=A0AAC9FLS0_AERVE|nr:hypothetical protein [Aeromonas veronii]ANB52756.1 hypothetical protein WM43_08800 [Aeromonas veronii]KZW97311.1 hypothetical protein WM54_04150 [Aeromonas veronii]MBL0630317.1 hypothetical protein [Aeromonas veronii]MCS0541884.1 hypothetical protein [Aeromonas veronii]BBT96621.1 hypothetical protein WP8W19C03_33150 [Aeromonas veronii]